MITNHLGDPTRGCVIQGLMSLRPENSINETVMHTCYSLDALVRWAAANPAEAGGVGRWRLYCITPDSDRRKGFWEFDGGRVSVQATGAHLIISALTIERLIEVFNEMSGA